MPARTNSFQKLAFHMHAQLAPDAEVKESDFLKDLQTGTEREVDIVVRKDVAGHKLCISVECIDHERPATVEWVEKMVGKHQTLPTDVLVLVSASGFTDEARAKAKFANVRAVDIGDALVTDWTKVVGKSQELFVARFDFTPTGCVLLLKKDDGAAEHAVNADLEVVSEDGTRRNTVLECALNALHDTIVARQIMDRLTADGSRDGSFEVTFPNTVLAVDSAGQPHEIKALRISFTATRSTDAIPVESARWEQTPVAFGEGTTSFGKTFLAISEPEPEMLRGLIGIKDPKTGEATTISFSPPETE